MAKREGLLAIDPGAEIGMAYFRQDSGGPQLIEAKSYSPYAKHDWLKRVTDCCIALRKFIVETQNKDYMIFTRCVIEMPEFMQSFTGQTSAKQGALVKLCVAVGAELRTVQVRCPGIEILPIEVSTWKGQLPKDVVMRVIKDTLPYIPEGVQNHAWDAVGIGMYALGMAFREGRFA